jgi:orotate phosphoribosyltransferase
MGNERYLKIFRETGALHEGHFKLTSGLHSAVYFQCALVLQYPRYTALFAEKIVAAFTGQNIDTVITPAVGGIVIGQEVGRQLDVRTIFSERRDDRMMLRRGFALKPGERVLVCEDVVTTGGSVFEVIDLARGARAEIVGVGFIVDRSGGSVKFGVKQFSVMEMQTETFQPDECPMCARNMPIEKPGSRMDQK